MADQPHPELPSYDIDEKTQPSGWRALLRGRRGQLVIVLALLAGLAFLAAKPLYRELKVRRALDLAEAAGTALDRGEGVKAADLLRQAALMAYGDERVADLVNYQAARSGDQASVAKIGEKLGAGRASPGEILVFGERSLSAGRPEDAKQALERLPAGGLAAGEAVRRAILEAGLLAAQGRGDEAESVLRSGLSAAGDPEADRLRLALAKLLLADEEPSRADEARQLLEAAAEGEDSSALEALRMLAAVSAGSSPGAGENFTSIVTRLRAHPQSTATDDLVIAKFAVAADPSQSAATADELVSRLRERGASLDERVAAARWLVGLSAHQAVLELVGTEEIEGHAGALMVRIDALSGLGRWDECRGVLEAHRGGALPDTLYHLFRARIAAATDDPAGADAAKRELRRAMRFDEQPHVLFAARYAEAVGWKPEAFAAWLILASDSGTKAEALRGQIRNLPPTANAAEGLSIARELLGLQPQDPSTRLSAAFFALLAGQNIEASAATAEEFLAADPESVDIRRVASLARLRTGQAAQGLSILPDDNGESRWQALHAALLRADGREEEADRVAAKVDADALAPEERAMLGR